MGLHGDVFAYLQTGNAEILSVQHLMTKRQSACQGEGDRGDRVIEAMSRAVKRDPLSCNGNEHDEYHANNCSTAVIPSTVKSIIIAILAGLLSLSTANGMGGLPRLFDIACHQTNDDSHDADPSVVTLVSLMSVGDKSIRNINGVSFISPVAERLMIVVANIR